jgi:hypothetical protein
MTELATWTADSNISSLPMPLMVESATTADSNISYIPIALNGRN